jgi:hypothetical protein
MRRVALLGLETRHPVLKHEAAVASSLREADEAILTLPGRMV